MKRTRRDAFTLVELLVVIAIMGTPMSILLPAVQAVREAARKVTCKANLAQVVKALQLAHDGRGKYPAGLSADNKTKIDPWKGHTAWVHLLLYLDQRNVYDQYNFLLPSEHLENARARSVSIPSFRCPSDESDRNVAMKDSEDDRDEFSRSNYALCFGSEKMGQDEERWRFKTDGAFRVGKARREADFYKGKTKTVMASELIAGMKDKYSSGSYDLRGVWAFYEMGSFAYTHLNLPNSEEPDAMLMGSGEAHCVDRKNVMPCEDQGSEWYEFHAAARSRHPGGVHIAFAGEVVEWINDDIELDVWRRMGSQAEQRPDEDRDVAFEVQPRDRF